MRVHNLALLSKVKTRTWTTRNIGNLRLLSQADLGLSQGIKREERAKSRVGGAQIASDAISKNGAAADSLRSRIHACGQEGNIAMLGEITIALLDGKVSSSVKYFEDIANVISSIPWGDDSVGEGIINRDHGEGSLLLSFLVVSAAVGMKEQFNAIWSYARRFLRDEELTSLLLRRLVSDWEIFPDDLFLLHAFDSAGIRLREESLVESYVRIPEDTGVLFSESPRQLEEQGLDHHSYSKQTEGWIDQSRRQKQHHTPSADLAEAIQFKNGGKRVCGNAVTLPFENEGSPKVLPKRADLHNMFKSLMKERKYTAGIELFNKLAVDPAQVDSITTQLVMLMSLRAGKENVTIRIFDDMKGKIQPTIFMYTTAVDAFGKIGNLERIDEVVTEMREHGVAADSYFLVSVVNAFVDARAYTLALEKAYELSAAFGIAWNSHVSRIVLNASVHACGLRESEKLLQKIVDSVELNSKSRNILYTVLISAYAEIGDASSAVRLFRSLEILGTRADKKAFSSVMHAYAKEMMSWLEESQERGIEMDKHMYSIMIDCLVKSPQPAGAIVAYEAMIAKELPTNYLIRTNVIQAYGVLGDAKAAQKIFDSMKEESNEPITAITYQVLMKAYLTSGDYHEVIRLYREIIASGRIPTNGGRSLLVKAFAGLGRVTDALNDLARAVEPQGRNTERQRGEFFESVIDVRGRSGDLKAVKDAMNAATEAGVGDVLGVRHQSAIALLRCDDLFAARDELMEMIRRSDAARLPRRIVKLMTDACSVSHGEWMASCLRDLTEDVPSSIYVNAIEELCHRQAFEAARYLIAAEKCEVPTPVYERIMLECSRSSDMKSAGQLIETMRERGLIPSDAMSEVESSDSNTILQRKS